MLTYLKKKKNFHPSNGVNICSIYTFIFLLVGSFITVSFFLEWTRLHVLSKCSQCSFWYFQSSRHVLSCTAHSNRTTGGQTSVWILEVFTAGRSYMSFFLLLLYCPQAIGTFTSIVCLLTWSALTNNKE